MLPKVAVHELDRNELDVASLGKSRKIVLGFYCNSKVKRGYFLKTP